ncbi:hypothetical protein CUS_5578 [Ruminococcus albus 8]|uniref:Uncharacterized protein n=1 Tax=Ruminococcus albus 8 TaxID=246199 RepID=E9S8T3_RUMAL|nr:hypothetical protein CUS_5578 [Ruminococcus albus 8]
MKNADKIVLKNKSEFVLTINKNDRASGSAQFRTSQPIKLI